MLILCLHAIGAGEAVFVLNCPDGPLELREAHGVTATQIRQLARAIEPEIRALCVEWRKIHGRY